MTGPLLQDLRFALRVVRRAPGFALAAILSLALGIGATTAIFSVADALLLRRLPYPNSDRLVMVFDQLRKLGINRLPLNDQTFRQYSAQDAVFESTSGFLSEDGTLITGTEPEHMMVLDVMPTMFQLLGVKPALGREFNSGDADVAVLSYPLYLRRFAADPSTIGRTVRLDDRSLKIVGVLPEGFEFNVETPDLWIPMKPMENGRWGAVNMIARLKSGVSISAARTSMDALARHLEETLHLYRGPHGEDRGYAARLVPLHDEWLGEFRSTAGILLAAVGAVLLIVLVNVANLMLVHAVSREKEFAVRRALGASETRLVRQRITESAVLASIGGAVGTLASVWAIKALIALSPARLPAAAKIAIDARALGITLAISAVVCLIFGLAPTVAERRLKFGLNGVRPKLGAAPVLVIAEAALATLLLIEAGLLLKSFEAIRHVKAGFNGEDLLTMEVDLPAYRYPEERTLEFFTQVREHISALPGVLAATSGSRLPINGAEILAHGGPFSIEGRSNGGVPLAARSQTVDLDYFRTLQIPLIAGRGFGSGDTATTLQVAIVNDTFARQFFSEGGVIGRRIVIGGARPNAPWMTIVGIAGDIKAATLDEQTLPHIYMPLAQHSSLWMALAARTTGDPLKIAREAAGVVHSVNPEVAPTAIMTMQQRISQSISRPRFETVITAFFAAVALFLAAVGIFGVVAHSTMRRTKEIGIRMALGADRGHLVCHVIVRGMRPVIVGIFLGIAGALALSASLASLLFQVKPADPWIIALAALALTGVAIAACLIPARRAARVNPSVALRTE
jgi:predicted permease